MVVGVAAHTKAGPAVILSYVFAGVACMFSALCYSEFSTRVPISGSAYTYAYTVVGEFMAWSILAEECT
jgi:APA family basic amino acid/polyamine antiporter